MKKSPAVFVLAALVLGRAALFSASAPTRAALSDSDQAWSMLQVPVRPVSLPIPISGQPVDPREVNAARSLRAAAFVSQADRARDFQDRFAGNEKTGEAKLMEIRALVSAVEAGDATVTGRLASAVQALRSDSAASRSIQVQAVAASEFSRQTRILRTHADRLKAIEQVARGLTVEFPDQPQGFESLLTIAATDRDETNAKKIARDLLAMPASAFVKLEAQKVLDRFALVGKPLAAELDGANETATKSSIQPGVPTIVYTWATWSPGSLALASDLKKRGLAANIVALNLDTDVAAAQKAAADAGLIGTLVYDDRGKEGALAQRLKIRGAGEVTLVDAAGTILVVRGQGDLNNRLQQLGL